MLKTMKHAITLDLTRPHTRYLSVTCRYTNVQQAQLSLVFPAWVPGSYLIRDFAADVEDFAAQALGKPLVWTKIDKSCWQIQTNGHASVTVTYRFYAFNLNVRQGYADDEMVFANLPALLPYPDGYLHERVRLTIKSPKGWKHAQALPKGGLFANYDALYDAPLLAAKKLEVRHFQVGQTSYQLAIWGDSPLDYAELVKDVAKIVKSETHIFKSNPNPRYVFQILFVKGQYGGLEHRDSSTNIFDGSILNDKKDYRRFLALLAHEHFHLWNVKRIRPEALGPFDYTKEVYTRELWVAEGVTSYYDDHILLRAGLYTTEQYLALLADNLNKLENQRANRVNTLSDSSFDAWTRFYKPHENQMNTVVSYYLKGGLIMMLLDWHILKASQGKRSLDDVMRGLQVIFEKRPERGFSREEFDALLTHELGKAANQFLTDHVDGVKPVDWKAELQTVGLELKDVPKSFPYYLGVILGKREGKLTVLRISEDSPAYDSALIPGDEILAFDGRRAESDKDLDACLKRPRIKVLFSRYGRVREVVISLVKNQVFNKTIVEIKKTTPAQLKLRKAFFRS